MKIPKNIEMNFCTKKKKKEKKKKKRREMNFGV